MLEGWSTIFIRAVKRIYAIEVLYIRLYGNSPTSFWATGFVSGTPAVYGTV